MIEVQSTAYFVPDWPSPTSVACAITLRFGGVSKEPFLSNNFATHVGDDYLSVISNRERLQQRLSLPEEPRWLKQVHGNRVIGSSEILKDNCADGSFSEASGEVCVVLTADCVPVLLCNRNGDRVAAIHAGWRGLASNIIKSAVAVFHDPVEEIMAYLGPAIGPTAFEVGSDVLEVFIARAESECGKEKIRDAFLPCKDRYLANLYSLTRVKLKASGVEAIYGGDFCTWTDKNRFFSYRRDQTTGRNASLIWLR